MSDIAFHPRCWVLADAPSTYPTRVGTVSRTRDGSSPGSAWFDEATFDWVHVRWVQVPNPKDYAREEWSNLMAERGLPDMPARAA